MSYFSDSLYCFMGSVLSNCIAFFLLGLAVSSGVLTQVLAQAPNSFRHLQKSDGLSQSSVFAIGQDSSGFMWFGTRDGLNRYDGHDVRIYRPDESGLGPAGNDVRALLYDHQKGGMWVGTADGLSLFSPESDRFQHYAEVKGAIRGIYQSARGRIWVAAASGLYSCASGQEKFDAIQLRGAGNIGQLITTLVEKGGDLWLATSQGLYLATSTSKANEFTYEAVELGQGQVSNQRIQSMYLTKNGTLFFGTFENGLFRLDINSKSVVNYRHTPGDPSTIADNNVRALCPDGRGGLWIATFDGLSHLAIATEVIKTDRSYGLRVDELSDNSIHCLLKDVHGSLWIGTYYGGVNHLNPVYSRFRSYLKTSAPNSLGADVVSSFAEDDLGNIYVGTEGAGLDYLFVDADTFTHYRPGTGGDYSISGPNVKSLLLEGDKLWIGTYKEGLNVLDITTGKFDKYRARSFSNIGDELTTNFLPDNSVYALLRYGKYLWIGTYGGGLSLLDTEAGEFTNFKNDPIDSTSLISDFVSVLYKKDDQIWIGTDAGLQRAVKNDIGSPTRYETVLSGNRIRVIFEDEKQVLWVGTLNDGLYKIEAGTTKITQYTVRDGLAGNTIYGILSDDQGNLWLSTNDGLSLFNPVTNVCTNFEHPSGMSTGEFNVGAYLKLSSGELLFGGLDGFTKFDPSSIKEGALLSPLVFTDLKKQGKRIRPGADGVLRQSINDTERLSFAYNEANFTIGLTALDYLNPENNIVQYKLEGIDTGWETAKGKVEATYTIQRHGDYKLLARTVSNDEQISSEVRSLNITVLPPLWRTWWAYLGYLCLAVLAVYGVYRFIRLRHNYELEHLARQRDEELHEGKLRFFTNITHEFRTPLTLILGPLDDLLQDTKLSLGAKNKLMSIERNSRRLLSLVDRVLTFRKLASEHGRLRGARNDLNWFLRKLHETFHEETSRRGISFTLEAETAPLWVWYDSRMLEMAIASLLSNALKFTPDKGEIGLRVKRVESEHVEIRVEDNGPGVVDELKSQIFQRFYEDPSKSQVAGSGIGLSVASDLIALHQGSIHVEDTKGGGATFIVRFPVGKEHFTLESANEPQEEDELRDKEEEMLDGLTASSNGDGHSESMNGGVEHSKRSKVLIVEDNYELRSYLGEIFEHTYDVELAADGVEGFQSAQIANAPDIIVSDVMMPRMNGFELCEKVKTNLGTSHIPVLLLTAKTGEHDRMDGLRLGADDYIAKPFVPEELLLRVKNTLDTRRRVREVFSRVVNLDPKEISVTSADEEFLLTALEFVEEHIDDLELNVVRLAEALNVSRALLFTKLKALTNQTPGNFIKSIRLKRAAQLLSTDKLNIAQVSYAVGFRDPKYFSKCFKESYGVSALGYMKQRGAGAE